MSYARQHSVTQPLDREADAKLPPEVVLPEQYFTSSNNIREMPEKRLMRAVLEDALRCFMGKGPKQRRKRSRLTLEAEEWINSKDERWPFSFVNICYVLDIDPDYLRLGLKDWRAKMAIERTATEVFDFPKQKQPTKTKRAA